MGEEKESRDTQTYEETHNQVLILEDIQTVSYY
jgi:hypothetical protein